MKYIPFLKGKQNEFRALKGYNIAFTSTIKPFIDIPRIDDATEENVKKQVDKTINYIDDLYKKNPIPLYIDTYDIKPITFSDGTYIYKYVLSNLKNYNITPVIGLDRDEEHIDAVNSFLNSNGSHRLALRLLYDDLDSFSVTKMELQELLSNFDTEPEIDLILDMRLINDKDVLQLSKKIQIFLSRIDEISNIKRIIVSCSTIPSAINELVETGEKKFHMRKEWELWELLNKSVDIDIIYGDYTVVSPEYSDANIPINQMRIRQTPRIIYTDQKTLFITRGRSLKTYGDKQFFELSRDVLNCGYFRKNNSNSEIYIEDVANRNSGRCGNASKWIEITVLAHIAFISMIL